jgi:hypothetical protein
MKDRKDASKLTREELVAALRDHVKVAQKCSAMTRIYQLAEAAATMLEERSNA